MAKPRPGMGRGLEAILSVSAQGENGQKEELRELPIELIAPNPRQPRSRFDEEGLQALAGSLGAPFWFDMLNQIVNIRAAGVAPAERKVPKREGGTPDTPEP